MRELPRAAALYILFLATAAAVAALRAAQSVRPDAGLFVEAAVFCALGVLAELKPLKLSFHANQSVAVAVNFAAVIALGPGLGILASGLASAISEVLLRKPFHKALYNVSSITTYVAISATVYEFLRRPESGPADPANLVAFVAYAAVNFTVNYALLCTVIALANGTHLWYVIVANYRGLVLEIGALYPIGVLMAVTYVHFGKWFGLLLLAVPTVAVYSALERAQQLREHTKAALEALADAVDLRDPYTAAHSLRVAEYADQIAAVLKLPFAEREMVVSAARVHDLGKISTPDAILHKEGGLTREELALMRQHPTVGAQILEKLPMYRAGARLVGHHHERLDGGGYPQGLSGRALPLGAYIISVADAFDAMTTDRPYRKGLPKTEALARLRANAGTQFLPAVVEALARSLPDLPPAAAPPVEAPPASLVPVRAEAPAVA